MKAVYRWTPPRSNLRHYKAVGGMSASHGWWATVQEFDDTEVVEVMRWYPGCAFSPLRETYADLHGAVVATERWIAANAP